jgi:translocator assembly and maintenance protein 41
MKGHGLRSNGLVTEMSGIVGYPATVQTLKGIISGGPVTTVRYSLDKLAKWWKG